MSQNPKVHFAHANGFPARSYQYLFNQLSSDVDLLALDKFAHNPNFPLKRGWRNQVNELVAYLESQSATPCYLVGHSFGAVVSYMAACSHPHLFKGLIMLDPPLITGLTSWLVKGLRPTPLFDRFTPAKQTLNRCTRWDKDTNLVDYFSSKALFKDMHPQCVKDYVDAAVEESDDQLQLDFDHRVEANIFRTIPLDLHKFYGKLRIPSLLVTGENTQVCRPHLIAQFIKRNQLTHQILPNGGHMFPLEQPNQVAELIKQQIIAWQRSSDQSQ